LQRQLQAVASRCHQLPQRELGLACAATMHDTSLGQQLLSTMSFFLRAILLLYLMTMCRVSALQCSLASNGDITLTLLQQALEALARAPMQDLNPVLSGLLGLQRLTQARVASILLASGEHNCLQPLRLLKRECAD